MSTPACLEFSALGGTVRIFTEDAQPVAAEQARQAVMEVQRRLSRFDPESELSRVNRDPRTEVPISHLMLAFASAARWAGAVSGGLVDATLLAEVEAAGYVESFDFGSSERPPLEPGPDPSPGRRDGWRDVAVDVERSTLVRSPGLRLDSGGLGKGLAADIAARSLASLPIWGVDCGGDLRLGGTARNPRRIEVAAPEAGGPVIASCLVTAGAVATSGTTKRSWTTTRGPAHHLIDPRTGRPADTGVVQATAMAPTAIEAEVRAKAALLSGPERAFGWLPDGGVVVTADGEIRTSRFQPVP